MTKSCWLALLTVSLGVAQTAAIRGRVLDPSGAALPGSLVRLLPTEERHARYRVLADENGAFALTGLAPGSYTVRAGQNGFLEKVLTNIRLHSAQDLDLGGLELAFAGCDAPDTLCCLYLGKQPPAPVSSGYLTMGDGDAADMELGRGPDVVLSRGDSSWYLRPVNGATVARDGCASARFGKEPVRLDGMGPGSALCVRTGQGNVAGVFVVDEVREEAPRIRFWHVTRKP
ncbi:MAG TPA: hypothetical protein DEH78_24195 [Solibacterales bacterium]|nr:hypothetical protein [Bryobacterales bacterium]